MNLEILEDGKMALALASIPKLNTLENKPPEWLWPSLLAEGGMHVIAGEPGAMKSMLALQIAIGVAQGELWGHPITPRPVIYLDKENPLTVVQQRVGQMGLLDENNLWYWGNWCKNEPPRLVDQDAPYIQITRYFDPAKPLFIFDSLIRFHGADENDSSQMAVPMQQFRSICDAGSTVMLLHHKGKPKFEGPSSPYRGSSEISGGCDIGFGMSKKPDPRGFILKLECFKNRFEAESTLEFLFDSSTCQIIPLNTTSGDDYSDILTHIIKNPGCSFQDIQSISPYGKNKTREVLNKLDGRLWEGRETGYKNMRLYYPL